MQRTTLYVPFNASPRGRWSLRRNSDLVGEFPTRDDALRQAATMIAKLRDQTGQPVDVKVEDESGTWRLEEVDGA